MNMWLLWNEIVYKSSGGEKCFFFVVVFFGFVSLIMIGIVEFY